MKTQLNIVRHFDREAPERHDVPLSAEESDIDEREGFSKEDRSKVARSEDASFLDPGSTQVSSSVVKHRLEGCTSAG